MQGFALQQKPTFTHWILKTKALFCIYILTFVTRPYTIYSFPLMLKSAFTLQFLALTIILSPFATAQDLATYTVQDGSKMWIDGTSNKSDWTVTATELSGFITKESEGTVSNPGIQQSEIVVPAIKIVSNRSSIMDRLMRNALKVQQHADITYALKSSEVTSSTDASYTLQTTGDLTVAGETREITMTVMGEQQSDGQIRFKGSYPMMMSDYKIQPPTAMYGALRTGNEVVVHFDLLVANAAEQE